MDIKLTYEQKEKIYREMKVFYIIEDIKFFIDEEYDTDINLDVGDFETIADIFLNREDCNLSYWNNIEIAIENYLYSIQP